MKSEIANELSTIRSLRDSLDIIEIIMGFVSSKSYNPSSKLWEFVTESLKMDETLAFGRKVNYIILQFYSFHDYYNNYYCLLIFIVIIDTEVL